MLVEEVGNNGVNMMRAVNDLTPLVLKRPGTDYIVSRSSLR